MLNVLLQANSYNVGMVSAPSWLHRFIIGKKGQNLAKVTQQMPKVCENPLLLENHWHWILFVCVSRFLVFNTHFVL